MDATQLKLINSYFVTSPTKIFRILGCKMNWHKMIISMSYYADASKNTSSLCLDFDVDPRSDG